MKFEIANSADIPDLVELRLAYLEEDHGKLSKETKSFISGRLPGYFQHHLNRELLAFVCRHSDIIVACCFLYLSEKPPNPDFMNGKIGTVLNVFTKPAYRRQGIAENLLQMLLSEAAKRELDYVELQATDAGYPLYQKLGFKDAVSKYHAMKYIIEI